MTVSCTGGGNTQEPSCPSTSLAVVKCLNLGYMPNSCASLKKCSASQYACLDKGYMPNSCESL